MRTWPIIALMASSSAALAQDQDLIIHGKLTDATTGAPLIGEVDVDDIMGTTGGGIGQSGTDGEFGVELYSYDSSYYLFHFTAPGHLERRAVIDLTELDASLPLDVAWEITMNVALRPDAGDGARSDDELLGVAVFDNADRTIRWTTKEAQRQFTIERKRIARLPGATGLLDTLFDQGGLIVAGMVRDHWTEKPMANVSITITDSLGRPQVLTTNAAGVYGTSLSYDQVYTLRFSMDGQVAKTVLMDTRGVPADKRETGYRAQVDMRLFKAIPGEDLSFLEVPIGRARYDAVQNNFTWDMDYTAPIQERLKAIFDRHPNGR